MHAEAERALRPPRRRASTRDRPPRGLSIADQQIIEIAKAISLDARVLIMDEPTAALCGVEVERLFAVARSLRDEGRALVFISHRFDEVFALCDTVTVMRDGAYISTDADRRHLGRRDRPPDGRPRGRRPLPEDRRPRSATSSSRSQGLTSPGVFHDISFTVRAGEIVGLAGLVGAGRSEIARAVFGVDPYDAGSVTLDGKPRAAAQPARRDHAPAWRSSPRTAASRAWSSRRPSPATSPASIRRGLDHAGPAHHRDGEPRPPVPGPAGSRSRPAPSTCDAATMSGGNQQKVVLAKWLATEPKLLIIDEPTRGIDVGTKAEVHRLLSELAGQGLAILMISSELPEVLGMADRVLVVLRGPDHRRASREDATPEAVMHAATARIRHAHVARRRSTA